MNKLILNDEQSTVIPFRLTGGSGVDENWLGKLEVGTCFLSREKNDKSEMLGEYHVLHKAGVSTYLLLNSPLGQTIRIHADSLRFSRKYDLVEILGVSQQTNEEEPNDNGPVD